jgi:small subunit ribosomal protein S16
MLAIRLQRLGRKAYPVYRIAVQESRRHPDSGRVVAYVGSYNPHTKLVHIDKEKAEYYLKNGAQPTPRVVKLLKGEKVALPTWVKIAKPDQKGATKHPDKLRKNQPKEETPVANEVEATEVA